MLIWHAVVFAAYFVKGLAGFGNSLIHTGVMAFFLDNAVITPVDLVLTSPANVALTMKHRAYLNKRLWIPAALVTVAALAPGALLLKNLDSRLIKLLFGALVILLGLDMLCPAKQSAESKSKGQRALTWGMVVLSGVISGMFGVGALLAAAMGRMTGDSRSLKANLSAAFVADNVGRIIIYILTGLLTLPRFLQALQLFPAMGAGLFLGILCAGKLSEKAARLCVVAVLVASGVMLIINNM